MGGYLIYRKMFTALHSKISSTFQIKISPDDHILGGKVCFVVLEVGAEGLFEMFPRPVWTSYQPA